MNRYIMFEGKSEKVNVAFNGSYWLHIIIQLKDTLHWAVKCKHHDFSYDNSFVLGAGRNFVWNHRCR